MLTLDQCILACIGLALCILLSYIGDIKQECRLKKMIEKYSKQGG